MIDKQKVVMYTEEKSINKTKEHINRGVEFILSGGNKKHTSKTITIGSRKMTLDTILVLVLPISLLFFFVGGLIGWVARDYMMNYREIPRPHPEMFDELGNLVPDDIVAFRFESNYDDSEDEDND